MAVLLNPSMKDDAKALQDFLLDIKCLEPLSEWTRRFNMFDMAQKQDSTSLHLKGSIL